MTTANIFEIQNQPTHTLIRFFGFVDAGTVLKIKPTLQQKISPDCRNLIIDLQQVDFLDSHGVGLFVSFLKQIHKNNGKIIFAGAEGQPSSVLSMVGFNGKLVTYCENASDAQALLGVAA